MIKRISIALLLATTALPAAPVLAQDAAATPQGPAAAQSEDEIIVTAQKRATNLQDTPLAISAFGGNDLRARQVGSIEDLAPSLPNVNFGRNLGIARIAIRGLGLDTTVAGQEGRVAYHADGVYVSRPAATMATFFDINRVEVVRGPQGTLYGRNATAGAVNVITNDPQDEVHGYAKLTAGNYNTFNGEAALTGPLGEGVSARVAVVKTHQGGYGKNFTTGQDIDDEHSWAVRAKVKLDLSPGFELILSGDYYRRSDDAFVYHYLGAGKPGVTPIGPALGGQLPANPRDTFANVAQANRRSFGGVSATAKLDLGFGELTSITAYREGKYRLLSDADDTNVQVSQIFTTEKANQFSEELRLAGSSGRLDWIVGGYYFVEDISGETRFSPTRSPIPALAGAPVFGLNFEGDFKTHAYAAFGQLDYEIADRLTLTAGIRYSHEKKAIDQRGATEFGRPYNPALPPNYTSFQDDSISFSNTSPKVGLEYKASEDVLLYALWSKGFKSGGFNLTGFAPPVRPEKLTDYEAGIKTQMLDGAVTFNLAAFYYDYKDLQVQVVQGAAAVLENAASARIKGVEAEVILRPVEGLELSGNASHLDSEFTRYLTPDPARAELGLLNLKGNQLPQAPKWTANGAAQYRLPVGSGQLTLRGELTYTARIYFSPFNRAVVSQKGFAKGNLLARYELDSGISASAFVRNVGNKRTIASALVSGSFTGFPIMGTYDTPRTYGVSIGYNF